MKPQYIVSQRDSSIRLTVRQVEVVNWRRAGLSQKEIAAQLGCSRDNVAELLAKARTSVGARNSDELIEKVLEHGILRLTTPPPDSATPARTEYSRFVDCR